MKAVRVIVLTNSTRASVVIGMLAVMFIATIDVYARDYPLDSSNQYLPVIREPAASSLSDTSSGIPWPTFYAVHQTGSVNAAVSCFGIIGLPSIANVFPYAFWPRTSFESPPGSGIQYLFGGSIWIGGIVGSDTLVTTGGYGGQGQELYPSGYNSENLVGTVMPFSYPTSMSLRAEFDDTIHAGVRYVSDVITRIHQPLNVAVVNRSHSFNGSPASNCIIHDLLVTNIGTQTIKEGYIGVLMDADIYSNSGNLSGYNDDMAGSIRDRGIAYIVDNDGDPLNGQYSDTKSPTQVLAFKFLRSSFISRDTNFNWWVPSYSYPNSSFIGPRQKRFSRDIGNSHYYTPTGDRNQYFMLSTPEWDYDQVMMSTIRTDDSVWMLPDSLQAAMIHRGGDTRFLMSIGPFDLAPDSTVSVQFAVFTAGAVHTDPFIMDFVDVAPEFYSLTLNLPSVVSGGAIADSLGQLLDDPSLPMTGLKVTPLTDDSALIRWDPWVWSDADSIEIYVSAIPDSAFRHPGVIPIWYSPNEHTLVRRVSASSSRLTLASLEPGRAYACNVALGSGDLLGNMSAPVLFRMPNADFAVQPKDSVLLSTIGVTPIIQWSTAATTAVDHFNVYRFANAIDAQQLYAPFYSQRRLDIGPVDSVLIDNQWTYFYRVPAFAQVPGDQFEFEDPLWSDGQVYVLAAVDSHGTEYPFSSPVSAYRIPSRTKDICVLTNSGGRLNFVSSANLKSFYNDLLTGYGYDYDIFSYLDSVATNGVQFAEEVIDWRNFATYRLLIIDDGMKDALLSSRFEDNTGGFRRYLETGGTIAYFGSFTSLGEHRYDITTEPAWFELTDKFATDCFGVDSLFYVGSYYYRGHTTAPYVDSLFGFVRAQSAVGAPEIQFDNSQSIFSTDLKPYWPSGTAPSVSTFRPDSRAEVTYLYRSMTPATSVNEGQPVGVMTQSAKGQTYTFGFHLWYMEKPSARTLVDWIMSRSSTGSSDEPHAVISSPVTLAQNYPNPFNPVTTIEYTVPVSSRVRLEIFNILGQQVKTIADERKSAGVHRAVWDGRDVNSVPVSTGIYLYRLQIGDAVLTRKMLLLK